MPTHYLKFDDFAPATIAQLLETAAAVKAEVAAGVRTPRLANRLLLMYFEKASTRTRISFTAAMTQAGGSACEFPQDKSQMTRGESIADSARVLSSYCDVVMMRVNAHATVADFAHHASCPVINGLSDVEHPCQVLADVMTFQELRGSLAGARIAWIGDCSNVCTSWVRAAEMFGATMAIACPPAYRVDYTATASNAVQFYDDPATAAQDANLVMTDLWVSMGDADADARRRAFVNYQVSEQLMARADADAIFMHCLPAHRGEEVQAAVIDGKQSAVWQQAANRLHAQKALILHLLNITI